MTVAAVPKTGRKTQILIGSRVPNSIVMSTRWRLVILWYSSLSLFRPELRLYSIGTGASKTS